MFSSLWQSICTAVLPSRSTDSNARGSDDGAARASISAANSALIMSNTPELGSWVGGAKKQTRKRRRASSPAKPKRANKRSKRTVSRDDEFLVQEQPKTKGKPKSKAKPKPKAKAAPPPQPNKVSVSPRRTTRSSRPRRTTKSTRSTTTTAAATATRVSPPPPQPKPKPKPKPRGKPKRLVSNVDEIKPKLPSPASPALFPAAPPKTKKRPLRKAAPPPPAPTRRRRRGADAAIDELAAHIVQSQKKVVFITGAGLSVASGVRPFRTNPDAELPPGKHVLQAGLWNEVVWTMSTRESFRKNPAKFYNEFWIPHFLSEIERQPNAGHDALETLLDDFPDNVKQITQNIDRLQRHRDEQLIEVHGRVGLYKCCPEEDSDAEDDDEEEDLEDDEDRPVQLGHRRKSRLMKEGVLQACPYQFLESLTNEQLIIRDGDPEVRARAMLKRPPCCPACGNQVMPQSLLFDEGYHSHSFYQFEKAEDWLMQAEVIVFVGTSLGAVRLTRVALEYARENKLPVYNFNMFDSLDSTSRLNAANIMGDATEMLPKLVEACHQLQQR